MLVGMRALRVIKAEKKYKCSIGRLDSRGNLHLLFWLESHKMACCSCHQLFEGPVLSSWSSRQVSNHF